MEQNKTIKHTYFVTEKHDLYKSADRNEYNHYGLFNEKNLIINPAIKTSQEGVEYAKSKITYKHDKKECNLMFMLPTNFCFGINTINTFGEEKSLDNTTGYQIAYNLQNDCDEIVKYFDKMICTVAKYIESDKDKNIPKTTKTMYINMGKQSVKPIYDDKNKKMYIKLKSYGKGNQLKQYTKLFDFKKKKIDNIDEYMNKSCKVMPVLICNDIFFGSHGKSEICASIRFKLEQAFIKQYETIQIPTNVMFDIEDIDD